MNRLVTFAVVHSPPALDRACAELSELLQLRRSYRFDRSDALLGLWLDPYLVDHTPDALRWPGHADGPCEAKIEQAVGVQGIWALCWFALPAQAAPPSHAALLDALLAHPVPSPLPAPEARFVPVFPSGTGTVELDCMLHDLHAQRPGLLLPPRFQDPASGTLDTTETPHRQFAH